MHRRIRLGVLGVALAASLGFPTTAFADEPHTVTDVPLLQPYIWTYGCVPTSAAMVLSYWDSWAGTKYVGMGKLIKYYLTAPCEGTNGVKNNVPNTLRELKSALGTDYDVDSCDGSGDTMPWDIDDGVRAVTNDQNGYAFVSDNICEATWPQIIGDWCWESIKAEIDANRPFLWSTGHLSADISSIAKGHTVAAFGYHDDKHVMVYSTYSVAPDAWYYTDYRGSDDDSIEAAQVNRVAPGGWSDSDILLDDPIGNETLIIGGTHRVHWYQWGSQIASATIDASVDGGHTWSTLATVASPGAGWKSYDWQIGPGETTEGRLRVYAYDGAGNLVAADGSFGMFTVRQPCSDLVVQSITMNPASPMPYQEVNVGVTVRNQGTCDATPREFITVSFYKNRDSVPAAREWGDVNDGFPTIPAGGTATLTGKVTYSYEGVFKVWAQVDSYRDVTETNENNNVFGPQEFTVVTDDVPAGTITINGGALWTNSRSVVLNLTCTDLGSGCYMMSFFQLLMDGWTPSEPYAATKAWEYLSDYPVYVRFYDRSGNWVQSHAEIYVDEVDPVGAIAINGGAASTSNRSASLTLTCEDFQSRCASMRLSSNGATWTVWEPVVATRPWMLSAGDGPKSVYVQFRDNAGNFSAVVQATILLQTVLPGDVTGDGRVDMNDVNMVLRYRNQPASSCQICDVDGDGMITALDARKIILLCTLPGCK